MTEKIRRSRVQISQGWCLYAVLGKFSLSKSKNYSFLEFLVNIYIEFSIVSSKRIVTLCQVVSIMEIPGGFRFNLVLWPAIFGFDLFYQLMELRSWIQ
ncbi:unnamed protein product [Rotaria socialis]